MMVMDDHGESVMDRSRVDPVRRPCSSTKLSASSRRLATLRLSTAASKAATSNAIDLIALGNGAAHHFNMDVDAESTPKRAATSLLEPEEAKKPKLSEQPEPSKADSVEPKVESPDASAAIDIAKPTGEGIESERQSPRSQPESAAQTPAKSPAAETTNAPSPKEGTESQAQSPKLIDSQRLTPIDEDAEIDKLVMAIESTAITEHFQIRAAIRRSIALVLRHDGFDTATPDAMESFTAMVETYLESMIEETTRFATAARREHPIPTDFEHMLNHHNLPIRSLKPHLKNPVPQTELAPKWDFGAVPQDEDAYTTLPLLSDELSGKEDKANMSHIPSFFPDFPSRHTYRFTVQEDTNTRDSQRVREEAARTAQQGEEALRRLVRASKMRKQKEVKTLVERDPQGKERFQLWEATMRRFMTTAGGGDLVDPAAAAKVDIADHSMIVNAEGVFARKEVGRSAKRNTHQIATK